VATTRAATPFTRRNQHGKGAKHVEHSSGHPTSSPGLKEGGRKMPSKRWFDRYWSALVGFGGEATVGTAGGGYRTRTTPPQAALISFFFFPQRGRRETDTRSSRESGGPLEDPVRDSRREGRRSPAARICRQSAASTRTVAIDKCRPPRRGNKAKRRGRNKQWCSAICAAISRVRKKCYPTRRCCVCGPGMKLEGEPEAAICLRDRDVR